jgi:putative SOS response-associated peptidase YedK
LAFLPSSLKAPTNSRPKQRLETQRDFLLKGIYDRWLGIEPDPRELLKPFPVEPMMMWPVSTRVNTPKNDDPDILTPVVQADTTWPRDGNSA